MKNCLIIFAKEPEKGKVKTRLSNCFSSAQCLNLYKAFVKDTLSIAKRFSGAEKILAYEAGGARPRYLLKTAPGFKFYKQRGKDLGERMHNAFCYAQKNNAQATVIIGSDTPTLPAAFIARAFKRLRSNDLVIGPSFDGGYYLIGMRKPCAGIFSKISWSAPSVFSRTIDRARSFRKSVSILDKWYDLDGPEALTRLKRDLSKDKYKPLAKWTKRFLKNV